MPEIARAMADRLGPGCVWVADTGSGSSRDSGVPTFRGAEGLWQQHRAEDVATIQALRRDPAFFWRFHDSLREVILSAAPNPGHYVLAQMETAISAFGEFTIITQNIDQMHQRAGSDDVIEVHGDALAYHCMDCGGEIDEIDCPCPEYPPTCEDCGGVVRPDVVLFGEMLPEDALARAEQLSTEADVFLVIGTSVIVQPAALFPFIALEAGALVVEINPNPTPLTGLAQYTIHEGSAEALPALWSELQKLM